MYYKQLLSTSFYKQNLKKSLLWLLFGCSLLTSGVYAEVNSIDDKSSSEKFTREKITKDANELFGDDESTKTEFIEACIAENVDIDTIHNLLDGIEQNTTDNEKKAIIAKYRNKFPKGISASTENESENQVHETEISDDITKALETLFPEDEESIRKFITSYNSLDIPGMQDVLDKVDGNNLTNDEANNAKKVLEDTVQNVQKAIDQQQAIDQNYNGILAEMGKLNIQEIAKNYENTSELLAFLNKAGENAEHLEALEDGALSPVGLNKASLTTIKDLKNLKDLSNEAAFEDIDPSKLFLVGYLDLTENKLPEKALNNVKEFFFHNPPSFNLTTEEGRLDFFKTAVASIGGLSVIAGSSVGATGFLARIGSWFEGLLGPKAALPGATGGVAGAGTSMVTRIVPASIGARAAMVGATIGAGYGLYKYFTKDKKATATPANPGGGQKSWMFIFLILLLGGALLLGVLSRKKTPRA